MGFRISKRRKGAGSSSSSASTAGLPANVFLERRGARSDTSASRVAGDEIREPSRAPVLPGLPEESLRRMNPLASRAHPVHSTPRAASLLSSSQAPRSGFGRPYWMDSNPTFSRQGTSTNN